MIAGVLATITRKYFTLIRLDCVAHESAMAQITNDFFLWMAAKWMLLTVNTIYITSLSSRVFFVAFWIFYLWLPLSNLLCLIYHSFFCFNFVIIFLLLVRYFFNINGIQRCQSALCNRTVMMLTNLTVWSWLLS